MRKLAWFLLILLVVATVVITLGITNYAGIGTSLGGILHNSILNPTRNFIVDKWLFIGTSGWYILATVLGIGIVGGLFLIFIAYGLFWQKLVQEKIRHKTTQPAKTAPSSQPAPAPTPLPLPTAPNETVPIEKPEEAK